MTAASELELESDLQGHLLQGVSRTFALTIPRLPQPLAAAVTNAYLLCRAVDTVEDEPEWSAQAKRRFSERFVRVVAGELPPEPLAAELSPRLSSATIAAEHELIAALPDVIRQTRRLSPTQYDAVRECIAEMAAGMVEFQSRPRHTALDDIPQLNRYCYYVAGVVGVMLTRLFCDHSPAVARRRETLMALAQSFGQGLQMTNILKDIWEDRERGCCWLPRDVFADAGFDLHELGQSRFDSGYERGLESLIAIAHVHLRDALRYTLNIPRQEPGIRDFCFRALAMAMLTLRKINRNRHFRSAREVKISRRSVRATVVLSRLAVQSDWMLKALFFWAGQGLPVAQQNGAVSQPTSSDSKIS